MKNKENNRIESQLEALGALSTLFKNLWFEKVKKEIKDEKVRAYLMVFEDAFPLMNHVAAFSQKCAEVLSAKEQSPASWSKLKSAFDELCNDQERITDSSAGFVENEKDDLFDSEEESENDFQETDDKDELASDIDALFSTAESSGVAKKTEDIDALLDDAMEAEEAIAEDEMGLDLEAEEAIAEDEMGLDLEAEEAIVEDEMGLDLEGEEAVAEDEMGLDLEGEEAFAEDEMGLDLEAEEAVAEDEMGLDLEAEEAVAEDEITSLLSEDDSVFEDEGGLFSDEDTDEEDTDEMTEMLIGKGAGGGDEVFADDKTNPPKTKAKTKAKAKAKTKAKAKVEKKQETEDEGISQDEIDALFG